MSNNLKLNREDPDGPPSPSAGFFGLPDCKPGSASALILGVPFGATVSFRTGTEDAPDAIRRASHQVDLFDLDVGDLSRHAIATEIAMEWLDESDSAREHVEKVIFALENNLEPSAKLMAEVNAVGKRLTTWVQSKCADAYDAGSFPFIIGGDHSVALGALRAATVANPDVGVLHIDAHADMREAYEGFTYSHASVMYEFRKFSPRTKMVSVGLRDMAKIEHDAISKDLNHTAIFDPELRRARFKGSIMGILERSVEALPKQVYISLDIDGLMPTHCPNTGTPVPGGLSYSEVIELFALIRNSGRSIVGADLCEVAPGPLGPDGLDASVAARLIYKIIGFALNPKPSQPS